MIVDQTKLPRNSLRFCILINFDLIFLDLVAEPYEMTSVFISPTTAGQHRLLMHWNPPVHTPETQVPMEASPLLHIPPPACCGQHWLLMHARPAPQAPFTQLPTAIPLLGQAPSTIGMVKDTDLCRMRGDR